MVVSLYLDSIGVSKYKDDQYIFICHLRCLLIESRTLEKECHNKRRFISRNKSEKLLVFLKLLIVKHAKLSSAMITFYAC